MFCATLSVTSFGAENPTDMTISQRSKIEDKVALLPLGSTKLGGILGERYDASHKNRLLEINENDLLDGFRKRPGVQDWIGEHVGKWLHAAALVTANTQDTQLREKMDRVVKELLATQESDGYLGTYLPQNRMSLVRPHAWDVWIHKYDIIGLLAYYQISGYEPALDASKRAADLLIQTFGPGKKDINLSGEHAGMAPTSVLEPIVLLYRQTGEQKYLDFANTIVDAWETSTGAHVISSLLKDKCVKKVGNAKAYEMLSDLCGLCELYRTTGEKKYLDVALIAWEDIAKNHLYITGTGSTKEHWADHGWLPYAPDDNIGEICVTVTWLQFNLQLYRLLGESRFVDQMERSIYNHMLGAQHPSGEKHCYYMPLKGSKPFKNDLTCCFSSLGRGVALLPEIVYAVSKGKDGDVVDVNLLGGSQSKIKLPSGGTVTLSQKSATAVPDKVEITVSPDSARKLEVRLRIPEWAKSPEVTVNEESVKAKPGAYLSLNRTWKLGDVITLKSEVKPVLVSGDFNTSDRVAIMLGPLVFAADEQSNPSVKPLTDVVIAAKDGALELKPVGTGSDSKFEVSAELSGKPITLVVQPFLTVGADGSPINVWFRKSSSGSLP